MAIFILNILTLIPLILVRPSQQSDFCTNDVCRNGTSDGKMYYSYLNGVVINNTILYSSTTIMEIFVETVAECTRECLHNELCFSVNIGPVENELRECQLLAKNLFADKAALQSQSNWTHISMKSTGCMSRECMNGGTCVPLYDEGSYECSCTTEYEGAHCEDLIPVDLPNPGSKYLFEDTPDSGTIPLVVGTNGKKRFDFTRNGTVLRCTGEGSCMGSVSATDYYDANCIRCTQASCGFTIAFWIKLAKNQEQTFHRNNPIRILSQESTTTTGFSIELFYDQGHWRLFAKGLLLDHRVERKIRYDDPYKWHQVVVLFEMAQAGLNLTSDAPEFYIDGLQNRVETVANGIFGEIYEENVDTNKIYWIENPALVVDYARLDIDNVKTWIVLLLEEEIKTLYEQERVKGLI